MPSNVSVMFQVSAIFRPKQFIDHHDSFVMASGEVPRSLFYGDKISLRPAGTATLKTWY